MHYHIREYEASDHDDLVIMIAHVLKEFSMSLDHKGCDCELENMIRMYRRDNARFLRRRRQWEDYRINRHSAF